MPNMFVPFDLGVKDLTTKSAILTWDLNNVAEYKAGTYYKVYLSDNGTAFTEPAIVANIRTLSVPLKANEFWFAVTSIVDGLESVKSAPFKVTAKLGMSDSRDNSTVAIDINGNPAKLIVDENGSLKTTATLSTASISVAVSGGATESKQDSLIAAVSDLDNNITITNSDILDKLDELADKLDTILTPKVFTVETTMSNVGTDGAITFLAIKNKAKINRITVLKEFGSASQFKVELTNTNALIAERNIVLREFSAQQYDPNRIDVVREFSFINKDGQDLMGVRLTPDTGTSNIFYICITGIEA